MEEGEEVGDGRVEGSSAIGAIGDRGRAAISLMPDIGGLHVCCSGQGPHLTMTGEPRGFAQDAAGSRVFSSTTVQKHQFFGAQSPLQSNSQNHT